MLQERNGSLDLLLSKFTAPHVEQNFFEKTETWFYVLLSHCFSFRGIVCLLHRRQGVNFPDTLTALVQHLHNDGIYFVHYDCCSARGCISLPQTISVFINYPACSSWKWLAVFRELANNLWAVSASSFWLFLCHKSYDLSDRRSIKKTSNKYYSTSSRQI